MHLYTNFSSPKGEVALIDLWSIKTVKVSPEGICIRKGQTVFIDKQVNKLQLEVTLV